MKIGIVGLGLIGGSLARAYKRAGADVYGRDKEKVTEDFVRLSGVIDGVLDDAGINECDAVFLAIPFRSASAWISEHAGSLRKETLVIDCCGVKRPVCDAAFPLMETTDLQYIGGHPMAGRQEWGFKNSREDLYDGAVFVLVPKDPNDIRQLERAKAILKPAGFTRFPVMTPEEHDEVIAYTSQLSHVVSNAFVKSGSPEAAGSVIAGGSFRDMTRVAYLDESTWTEVMMENRDNLLSELEILIGELEKYRDALRREDRDALRKLLEQGRKRKEEMEGSK